MSWNTCLYLRNIFSFFGFNTTIQGPEKNPVNLFMECTKQNPTSLSVGPRRCHSGHLFFKKVFRKLKLKTAFSNALKRNWRETVWKLFEIVRKIYVTVKLVELQTQTTTTTLKH